MPQANQPLPKLAHLGGRLAITATPIVGEPQRDYEETFVPGQEDLEDGELRVTVLGSGIPWVTRAQASSSILVEVGNPERDLLLFDIGSGSLANFASLGLPVDSLDKVFLTHLHADHVADLMVLLGCYPKAGRTGPINVWGPSGSESSLGTKAFVGHINAACNWEIAASSRAVSPDASQVKTVEFDFQHEQIVYQSGGVTVTSFPVVHMIDGSVGYRIDFGGRSVVFSGDTCACWPLVNACQGEIDLLIHECVFLPTGLDRADSVLARNIAMLSKNHATAAGFGKVLSLVRPRMGALWHTDLSSPGVPPAILGQLREVYDGPAVQTQDLTVFNITKSALVVRQAQVQAAVPPVQTQRSSRPSVRGQATAPSSEQMMGARSEPTWFADARIPLDE